MGGGSIALPKEGNTNHYLLTYNSPSLPLLKKLKILNINQINDLHISLFMFDIHNNDLPLLFNELFKANPKCS